MNASAKPLTDDDLDRLDDLLLTRIGDEEVEGKDQGVLSVSELDGFLTAVLSSPVALEPSHWLPVMCGDFDSSWNDEESEEAIELILRHMNDIEVVLRWDPDAFGPIYMEYQSPEGPALSADEWCEGYMRGVRITFDQWQSAPEIADLLDPIRAFSKETNWRARRLTNPKEVDALRDSIVANVVDIYNHWLDVRERDAPPLVPFRHETPPAGRNDPCPCGSGKKYKKCCGAAA